MGRRSRTIDMSGGGGGFYGKLGRSDLGIADPDLSAADKQRIIRRRMNPTFMEGASDEMSRAARHGGYVDRDAALKSADEAFTGMAGQMNAALQTSGGPIVGGSNQQGQIANLENLKRNVAITDAIKAKTDLMEKAAQPRENPTGAFYDAYFNSARPQQGATTRTTGFTQQPDGTYANQNKTVEAPAQTQGKDIYSPDNIYAAMAQAKAIGADTHVLDKMLEGAQAGARIDRQTNADLAKDDRAAAREEARLAAEQRKTDHANWKNRVKEYHNERDNMVDSFAAAYDPVAKRPLHTYTVDELNDLQNKDRAQYDKYMTAARAQDQETHRLYNEYSDLWPNHQQGGGTPQGNAQPSPDMQQAQQVVRRGKDPATGQTVVMYADGTVAYGE